MDRRETLTHERIAADFKRQIFNRNNYYGLYLSLLAGLVFLAAAALQTQTRLVYYIAAATDFGLLIISLVIVLIRYLKVKKGDFRVEVAQIEKTSKRRPGPFNTVYVLGFHGFGTFRLVLDTYYTWSHNYTASAESIYERAQPGDSFYLIVLGKSTIGMVYNTACFQYQQE